MPHAPLANAGLHVTLVRDLTGLAALKEEWQSLLDRCQPNYVFMTWQWLFTWWSHFGGNRELFVLIVRDKAELIGIIPLALHIERSRRASKIRYLHFIGYRFGKRWTDYMDIIAVRKAEVSAAAFEYLRRCQHLWDVMELCDVLEDSDTVGILSQAAARVGFPFSHDETDTALCLRTDSDWESFYRTRAKDRSEFERRIRRLQERGELRVVGADASNMTAFMGYIFEFYRRRWDEPPASLALYRDFFSRLMQVVPQDWIRCSALELDGKPIAAQISLLFGRKLYHLMTAYDADFANFSPGRIHLKNLIEGCFRDENIVACYFGRGKEPYKYEWATEELSARRLRVSNVHMSGKIGVVLRKVPPAVRRPLIAACDAVSRSSRARYKS